MSIKSRLDNRIQYIPTDVTLFAAAKPKSNPSHYRFHRGNVGVLQARDGFSPNHMAFPNASIVNRNELGIFEHINPKSTLPGSYPVPLGIEMSSAEGLTRFSKRGDANWGLVINKTNLDRVKKDYKRYTAHGSGLTHRTFYEKYNLTFRDAPDWIANATRVLNTMKGIHKGGAKKSGKSMKSGKSGKSRKAMKSRKTRKARH